MTRSTAMVGGEVVTSLGIAQDLRVGGLTTNRTSPTQSRIRATWFSRCRHVSDGERWQRSEVVRTERHLGTTRGYGHRLYGAVMIDAVR
jgi:hypothetical protein